MPVIKHPRKHSSELCWTPPNIKNLKLLPPEMPLTLGLGSQITDFPPNTTEHQNLQLIAPPEHTPARLRGGGGKNKKLPPRTYSRTSPNNTEQSSVGVRRSDTLLFLFILGKGPVKLMQRVKTAHSFLQSLSNHLYVIILSLPV